MLMKKFVVEMHEEFGMLGLRPVDMPHADPLGGMAAVHDLLEHFPGDDGGIEDEFQALGASVWLRCVGGYYEHPNHRTNRNPVDNVASDFVELARHYLYEEFTLRSPGRTRAIDDDDYLLQEIVMQGFKGVREEIEDSKEFATEANRKATLGWLRKGYRRARRRYRKSNSFEMADLFRRIENTANKCLDGGDWYEGQRVTLKVCTTTSTFTIDEHEEDSY